MRRNKALSMLLALIVIASSIILTLTYLHDSPAGITPISSINAGNTPIGTNVTLKGRIIHIILLLMGPNDQSVTISDGSGSIIFFWTKTRLQIDWTVLVSGTVHTNNSLHPVSTVELVLLFP